VFDREFAASRREKALALREEASLTAQRSEFESRSQGLEVRKLELDKLSESLHQWRQELQETASQQATAKRKFLPRWESLTTSMEQALVRQRESLKTLKELAARKEASLQEKTCQLEAAQAALDAQVQEAVQEAARKLQEDQHMGAQRIIDWAGEASSALVPLGMSPIQVAEPPASIADALPVLNSASDRLRRLEPILAGHLEAEGRELCRMVAEYILTCLRSHDPAISLAPVVDGPVAETETSARESVRKVVDFVAAYFKREPADS